MRQSKPGEGATIIEMPIDPDRKPPTGEVTIPSKMGSLLGPMRMLAADLGIATDTPAWPSDVARAVAKLKNEQLRTEAAHRETLRQVATALEGREAPDHSRSAFVVSPAKLVEVARRMHDDLRRKDALCETISRVNDDLRRELEATRIELARVRQG
jgi:hypothetical protein